MNLLLALVANAPPCPDWFAVKDPSGQPDEPVWPPKNGMDSRARRIAEMMLDWDANPEPGEDFEGSPILLDEKRTAESYIRLMGAERTRRMERETRIRTAALASWPWFYAQSVVAAGVEAGILKNASQGLVLPRPGVHVQ